MAEMQARVSMSESRAEELESAGSNAREQILRLTADFENFRRRTVSCIQADLEKTCCIPLSALRCILTTGSVVGVPHAHEARAMQNAQLHMGHLLQPHLGILRPRLDQVRTL